VFPAESWVYRIAIWACWASRAGDGGLSGSREGQRRPVALRPPVDGGLVGNRGDRLPAVATLGRAATPYGAWIADAAVWAGAGIGGEEWRRNRGLGRQLRRRNFFGVCWVRLVEGVETPGLGED
jgi:hypothetical protein